MKTIIDNPDPFLWDKYVQNHKDGSFSHLHGWGEALVSAYNLRIYRLASIERGWITGLLPLILFPAPGADVRLISLPYSDAAGILSDNNATANVLMEGALGLAEDLNATHLELRQANAPGMSFQIPQKKWSKPCGHTFKIGLARRLPDSEKHLWDSVGAKVRNQVRKAEKYGCHVKIGAAELLEDCYAVFSENMRDLGSPVHSFELLGKAVTSLAARVFMVYLGDVPAAGAIVFHKGTTLYNPWASSLRRFRPQCPNMLLYWSLLAYGASNNDVRFDFGRSTPGASTCRFKQQWGAEKEPLTWYVFSRTGSCWNPLDESLENEDWKKMDLALSRRQGPLLRRWISL